MYNASMQEYVLYIGVLGAGIILLFFVLNELGKISHKNFWYDAGNMIGSGLLIIYAYLLGSIPFLILNVVWFIVSLRDVLFQERKNTTTARKIF